MNAQLPTLLRGFFEDYLAGQRDVSPNTILAYRDSFKLFLQFAARSSGRQVIRLEIENLGPDTVLPFLDHLETERRNCAATRNCRLVAIHRFFAYVADRDPRHVELCRRVLDIPVKKTVSNAMTYLDRDEIKALLATPNPSDRLGLRDIALLTFLYNTGARASEAVNLSIKDIRIETPSQVRILGKGRKERACPLWQETVDALRAYFNQRDDDRPDAPLFLNAHRKRITRFGVVKILKRHVKAAATHQASLASKRISPHTLRHYIGFRTMSSNVGCSRTQSEITDCSADGIGQSLDIVLLPLQTVEEAK